MIIYYSDLQSHLFFYFQIYQMYLLISIFHYLILYFQFQRNYLLSIILISYTCLFFFFYFSFLILISLLLNFPAFINYIYLHFILNDFYYELNMKIFLFFHFILYHKILNAIIQLPTIHANLQYFISFNDF